MARLSCLNKWICNTSLILILVMPNLAIAAPKKPQHKKVAQLKKQPKTDWFYRGLELNYILLNAADLVTTFQGLDRGAREINPIARLFINNKPVAIVAKTGLTLGVLAALRQARKHDKRAATITLVILDLFYSAVVTNNIRVNLQLKR